MPIDPKWIVVGKCYVTPNGEVWRVLALKAGKVTYEPITTGIIKETPEQIFARAVEAEVPGGRR